MTSTWWAFHAASVAPSPVKSPLGEGVVLATDVRGDRKEEAVVEAWLLVVLPQAAKQRRSELQQLTQLALVSPFQELLDHLAGVGFGARVVGGVEGVIAQLGSDCTDHRLPE